MTSFPFCRKSTFLLKPMNSNSGLIKLLVISMSFYHKSKHRKKKISSIMVFSCGFFITKCTVQFQWLHFSRFVLSTGYLYYYFQNSISCIFIAFSSLPLYESFGPKNFLIKPSKVLSRKSALFLYNRNIHVELNLPVTVFYWMWSTFGMENWPKNFINDWGQSKVILIAHQY